jgi:DNA invertase Pin-like site-specific DNA recombinase
MQDGFQRQRNIGSHHEAPCPTPRFEETRTRRHPLVWKLDRLGRSLRDLIATLDDLKHRGVTFRSLTEEINTVTPTGRAMWQMIGILAELEKSLIGERTLAGVKAAKRRGVKFGHIPKTR